MDKKTPLYASHIKYGGKIVPFAGYLLPVQYETGVITEHMAVRKSAGLFDVSHMGEIFLKGKDSLANVQMLVTNDCSNMYIGQVKYSPMCYEDGGVVDDLLVYKRAEESYLLVVNASNREKDVKYISEHLSGDVQMEDASDSIAQIALQGPAAEKIMSKLCQVSDIPVAYYTFKENVKIGEINALISRTGYTGEMGYELYVEKEDGEKLWELILDNGREYGAIPCGLGARDTLRLEAAMPLYGHEMDETITPLETGLSFAVKFHKEDFLGKEGLLNRGEPRRKRIGLRITGRGIARENCPVYAGDTLIGYTTSGTHLPYLGYPGAMAIVTKDYDEKALLSVEIRGKKVEAEGAPLPFYKNTVK